MLSSPAKVARLAGAFYLVTVLASILGMVVPSIAPAALGLAGIAYIGVTVLLYLLFKPVRPGISLLAGALSLTGVVMGPVTTALAVPHGFSVVMAFFGCYLILLGYLISLSGYLPRVVGVLLAIGGVGYLIYFLAAFLLPDLHLYPWIIVPGFLAETLFCFWILLKPVRTTAPV